MKYIQRINCLKNLITTQENFLKWISTRMQLFIMIEVMAIKDKGLLTIYLVTRLFSSLMTILNAKNNSKTVMDIEKLKKWKMETKMKRLKRTRRSKITSISLSTKLKTKYQSAQISQMTIKPLIKSYSFNILKEL